MKKTIIPLAFALLASTGAFAEELKPFGHTLFQGNFSASSHNMLNPDYRVHYGDPIAIKLWGTINEELRQAVDSQGNIFLPTAGPLQVVGMTLAEMQEAISEHVSSVYNESVRAYATLETGVPIAVMVTGDVARPGRYTGVASETFLYFLDQAGGPRDELGSYRRIQILRDNREIAEIDLYDFLQTGRLPSFSMRNGDIVFVPRRQASVEVIGSVSAPAEYEFIDTSVTGQRVIEVSRPEASATHVMHRGSRADGPFEAYVPLGEFAERNVRDGDSVEFVSDGLRKVATVNVEGAHESTSTISVPVGVSLADVLDNIAVDARTADLTSVHIRRKSVAIRQKQALEESLDRLARVMATSEAINAQDAQIRRAEAELISAFMARAKEIEPEGRVSLAGADLSRFYLEEGDVIVIPQKTGTITVSGEVMMPQSVVFSTSMSVADYVNMAGGVSGRGDTQNLMIRGLDGSVAPVTQRALRPGDEIIVLPERSTSLSTAAAAALEAVYKVALTAAAFAAF